jgi:hypothetical protein
MKIWFKIIFVLLSLQIELFAQDNSTEGFSDFSFSYISKEKKVSTKSLIKTYGDSQRVYWSKTQIRKINFFKEDTIRISQIIQPDTFRYVWRHNIPYFFKYNYTLDSSYFYQKVDSNILINNIMCDVYKDTSRKITAFLIKDKPLRIGYTSNFRDLIRFEQEREKYNVVYEKINQGYNIDTLDIFHLDKNKIVQSKTACSNMDSVYNRIKHYSGLYKIEKKFKFPNYLLFKNMEGRVILSFLIDMQGKPVFPVISPDFYRKSHSSTNVKNKRLINRTTRIIEKKLLKDFAESYGTETFPIPMSTDGPINIIVNIPLSYYFYSSD